MYSTFLIKTWSPEFNEFKLSMLYPIYLKLELD